MEAWPARFKILRIARKFTIFTDPQGDSQHVLAMQPDSVVDRLGSFRDT